jgi:RimJ/RimL family protein N-acetyltransferase
LDVRIPRCEPEVVWMDSARLIIEPLFSAHADKLVRLFDQRVNAHFAVDDTLSSLSDLRQQFSTMEAAKMGGHEGARFLPFVVKTVLEDRYIGRLEALIHGVDAEVAFLFVPQIWGKGFATEAIKSLIAHLGAEGIQRVWACVTPSNTASLKLCQKMLFQQCAIPSGFNLATYDDGDVVLSLPLMNAQQLQPKI